METLKPSAKGIKKLQDAFANKKKELQGDLTYESMSVIVYLDSRRISALINKGERVQRANFINVCKFFDLDWEEIAEQPYQTSEPKPNSSSATGSKEQKKGSKNPMLSSPYTQKVSAWIENKTKRFVGRDYVFNAFKDFTNQHKKGYFNVIAEPGEGKSTIVAKYVLDNPCVYYFNSRRLKFTSTAQFLEYTCKQLIDHYKLDLSFTVDKVNDGIFLQGLLAQISSRLKNDEKLVIVVDALDEADLTLHQREGSIALYLPEEDLPDKIYFLLTWRRDKNIKPLLPSSNSVPSRIYDLKKEETIDDDGNTIKIQEECNKDIRKYIENYLDEVEDYNELKKIFNNRATQKEKFVKGVTKKSKQNFMYLTLVLPEMIDGCYKDLIIQELKKDNLEELKLKSLPDDLNRYYKDHWIRMGMMGDDPPIKKIYIIYVMSQNGFQTGLSMTRSLIAKYSGQKETIVQWILDHWDQFLEVEPIKDEKNLEYYPLGYAFYHETYNDFLYSQEIIQSAGIDLKTLNANVADQEMPPDVEF